MMMTTSNVSFVGYAGVLLLAVIEWVFVLLYVYCLKRFRKSFSIKLTGAILAILASFAAIIGQGQIYRPVSAGRLSVNEFNVVIMAEKAVSLAILFLGIRKSRAAVPASRGPTE